MENKSWIKFNPSYFTLAVVVFLMEVIIALYIDDEFVRPYFGDFLVVVLMYCAAKAFLNITVTYAAIGVLIFSIMIETAQYFNFVALLGLQDSRIANVVFGNSFAWADIVAYTCGTITILLIEKFRKKPT